jgi:hypothetical protein
MAEGRAMPASQRMIASARYPGGRSDGGGRARAIYNRGHPEKIAGGFNNPQIKIPARPLIMRPAGKRDFVAPNRQITFGRPGDVVIAGSRILANTLPDSIHDEIIAG